MRVIAKLDVKPPFVVKPVHFEGLRKIGEPHALAERYYEQGADEIFYIDIVASLYRREVLFDQIARAAENVFVPFAAGGGVKNIEEMTRLFHCGADKIVLNTYALQHTPDLIDRAAHLFGAQSVVVSVEAKRWGDDWKCYSDCGRERSNRYVVDWVKEAESRGAGEILLQSVDMDGRQAGFDLELLNAVKGEISVPLVAASGAGSLEDVRVVARKIQPDAIAVASVLHYEKCSISDIKNVIQDELGETVQ